MGYTWVDMTWWHWQLWILQIQGIGCNVLLPLLSCDTDILQACRLIWTSARVRDVVRHLPYTPCTPLHWFPVLYCNHSAKNGVTWKEWFQLKRMLSYLYTRVQLFTRVQSKRKYPLPPSTPQSQCTTSTQLTRIRWKWVFFHNPLLNELFLWTLSQCKADWQGQFPCQQMKPTQKYIFVCGMKSCNTPTIVYFLYWQRIIQFMGILTICANVM